jgi:molybdenum cofactor cytidylyltransferase
MGRNKLLLEVEGEPVIVRAVRRAQAAGLNPVIVVLGHEAERVEAALDGLDCTTVHNLEFARGKNTSVELGIAMVPADASAALVLLPDMPLVTSQMFELLVERYRTTGSPLVVSRYGDVTAPPMLYDRSLFFEFDGSVGEACGKRILRTHREKAVFVDWPEVALTDLDSPADYELITGQSEAS